MTLNPNATPRHMILCLGPNRTGTSAVTAAIAALGAELGFASVYANDENQKGFFEHPDLITLNEKLLIALGGAWDSAGFHGKQAIAAQKRALGPLQREATDFLQKNFAGHDVCVMKDPRLCVLLDFWLPLVQAAGFDRIDCVHVLRSPVEAALSQQVRVARRPDFYDVGKNLGEGAALWLSYMGQMWDGFDLARHTLVSFDALVDRPAASLDRMARLLDLTQDQAQTDAFVTRFVDTKLRHSKTKAADSKAVDAALPQARPVFDALQPLCEGGHLKAADIVFVMQAAKAASGAIDGMQSAILARASNAKRAANAELYRLKDLVAEAERAAKDMAKEHSKALRDLAEETERAAKDMAKEHSKALHDLAEESERTQKRLRADFAKQRKALKADHARVTDDFRILLENTVNAYELQLAGVMAQIAQTRLSFERDVHLVQQERAAISATLASWKMSRSWRITAPIRTAAEVARSVTKVASAGWIRFNHFARRQYREIDKRSPQIAEGLRRFISPLFRYGNRAILHSNYVPAQVKHAGFVAGQPILQFDYQRPQELSAYCPMVSILVPNYNHVAFLRQRLDSIFAQTWTNYEVILMDDCSSDDSRAILQEYADRYADRTRVIFNDENSGGAFVQWERGMKAARGELIWVAESDDWCSLNFLETLVPFFANQAVQLAFVPSVFMNKDGTQQVWSMGEYLSGLGPDRWGQPFVLTAPQIVRESFAEKNIIPNASSAVFRLHDRLDVMENEVWRGMRTCGDWVFYLNQIRGGLVAYSPEAQNFYRQHPQNTSVTSFSKDSYYIEHEIVAKTVQRHYAVDSSVFQSQQQNLILHWTRNRPSFDRAEFDACYALSRIADEGRHRKPKLLMAGYAFCSGGGETFPITLANEMKTAGYDVTFLNCMQEEELPGIRNQLARDIPVVTNYEDLEGILRDFEIDVIHSHHAWVDNTILDILPETCPTKTVISLHGMYETMQDDQLKRTLPRLVKRTGAMVYTAEKNIVALVSRGLLKAADLPRIDNALAIGASVPMDRALLNIPQDAFVLAMVARAIPTKGWIEAIAAVHRAREISGNDIHLVIVGDGPEYDRLKSKVPPHIHLEGFRSDIRAYFAMADIGLLPSRFKGESFPLVLIDCLHAGKPVIASKVGEIPYMLTTPTGVAGAMFALKDWQIPVEDLALQIADLARNPRLLAEMTSRVPEASRRFDPKVMRDRYAAVYEGVTSRAEVRQAAE